MGQRSGVPIRSIRNTIPHFSRPLLLSALPSWLAFVAFRQWQVARLRHEEQTRADKARRIKSFAKAIEQLGSDKIQVRLGGIYTLERLSKESPDDYWPIMEILTAFVREQAPRLDIKEEVLSRFDTSTTEHPRLPATDIAAVLTVIRRRDKENHDREVEKRQAF